MSNSYKISFKQLQQESLKDTFQSIYKAMQALDIDFYLIGAVARDTWFAQKGSRALGTRDVDFAVLVANENSYDELKQFLIQQEGFAESSTNEYVLFDKAGQQIDLLPFGAIEIEGNRFIDNTGVIHTNISGFKEVYEAATDEVNFEGEYDFKVSSLAGIILLKLIAYDDRPEMRSKDIQDIGTILNNYFTLENEMILDKHIDLIADAKKWELVSARVIGREMQPILDRNSLLKERVLAIIDNNTSSAEESNIGRLLLGVINQSPLALEEVFSLLKEIRKGIEDEW